jgi:flagellar hook-associated protein 2
MGANGIYGLSGSSFDGDQISSMVKMGTASHQKKLDKQDQKLQTLQWTKENYLELTSKISTFSSSTLSQYKMATNMNAKSAESSSSAVKVTAGSNASLMSHKVDVSALSSNAYLISTGKITRYDGNDNVDADSNSIELKNILFKSISIDETTKKAHYKMMDGTASDTTIDYCYADLNDTAKNKAISFFISDGVTLNKDSDGNPIQGDYKKEEISFTFEEINNGATLNDLVSKINAAGLNIKASYDSVNDAFSLYNKSGGAENKISITTGDNSYSSSEGLDNVSYAGEISKRFLNSLQLYQSKDGELYDPSTLLDDRTDVTKDAGGKALTFSDDNPTAESVGAYGTIKVDGVVYDKITDNKVTVGGITYTALNKTDSTATVSVSQDTDEIIDKVKSFVEDYNKLLAELYEMYDEKPNSDYKPLTKAQREQMKDEQIEKWEKKAKAGMLYHDQTLGNIIMSMRTSIAESVEGVDSKYNSAFSLGISTTGLKGQLVLDEDKLKKALAEDPDAVYNVFAKLDSKDLNNSSKSGIAQRLGDISTEALKKIKDIAGSSSDTNEDSVINNSIRSANTTISTLQKQISALEKLLYKKYDAMEAAIAQLNSQYNLIAGQMLGQG